MSQYIKKYIITGAPGTGKTTLINTLEKNYPCMHEVSRKVIRREQQEGGDGMPRLNMQRFVELVFVQTKLNFQNNDGTFFHDRGLPDMIAYLNHRKLTIPEDLGSFLFHNYYQSIVFYAPVWEEIYVTDAQRPTTFEMTIELESELLSTYQSLGFSMIKIPFGTPLKRAEFIVNYIKNFQS